MKIIFRLLLSNPANDTIIFAGNFNDQTKEVTVKLDNNYLNVSLPAHSLNTFQMNTKK